MVHAIKETYVELNKVSTKITTIGKTIGETFKDGEDLVVIIPGNPGINSFYDKFAEKVHEQLKCSVWCVGHAGHNLLEYSEKIPIYKENKELYGLEGQVEHKVDFFAKYIPENVKVHVIGHSIGSYMALELLDDPSLSKNINHAYLLFPTLEYMAVTPNGKILLNYVKPIVWLILFICGVLAILPKFIQTALMHLYMFIVRMPTYNCDSIRHIVKPRILKRVFFLAYEEMDQVLERNNRSIQKNINKITLLYGLSDGWTPLSYYHNIKNDFPGINAQVTKINHAFVLKRGYEVGVMVSEWITTSQSN